MNQIVSPLQVHLVVMDVRDTPKAEALPSTLPPEFSEVDILINNAGLALGTQVTLVWAPADLQPKLSYAYLGAG